MIFFLKLNTVKNMGRWTFTKTRQPVMVKRSYLGSYGTGPTEMIFVLDWRYLKDPSGQTDENCLK